jgi:hypothetical protein
MDITILITIPFTDARRSGWVSDLVSAIPLAASMATISAAVAAATASPALPQHLRQHPAFPAPLFDGAAALA